MSKAARDFRRLHGERQELLQQWEGVLEAIRKRDSAILEAGKWLGACYSRLPLLWFGMV